MRRMTNSGNMRKGWSTSTSSCYPGPELEGKRRHMVPGWTLSPKLSWKKCTWSLSCLQESPKPEEQVESKPEAGKAQAPPEQQNNGMTEHLGLYVPHTVVNGAESKWSSSRLDLAIETELEKRRMEFELTRLKYEHEENERQRQHEEKMEQLRQQGVLPRKVRSGKLGDHLLMLQDHLTLFLYCFIFIHIIYIVKALVFFFIKKHVVTLRLLSTLFSSILFLPSSF
uniref:Uncharacterized protein n=1 Tax=Anolis carolinensis TaxID=28377 RepID=A0A803SQE3_ANOCA